MVADYFTKPLQGALFYKFRDQKMGVVPMDTIKGDHRSVLDDESNHDYNDPSSQTKTIARSKRAHTSAHTNNKAITRQSWVDVVKSKSLGCPNASLCPILKRSPILSL